MAVVVMLVHGCGDPLPLIPPAAPTLLDLSVAGGAQLRPAFEQDRSRYAVVAADGVDQLTIQASADPANTIMIDGVEVATGEIHAALAPPGSEIEIVVTNRSGEHSRYVIFFLPSDFPEINVIVPRVGESDGVTYLTLGQWLAIVDDEGVPTFARRELGVVTDFKLHESGERSFAVRSTDQNEFGRRQHDIVLLDSEFAEIDRVRTVGLNHTDNHEFLIRPNGNFVLLAYHGVLRDMSGLGGTVDQLVEESVVQEITRARAPVFEFTSWGTIPTTEALRDWPDYAHFNSVSVDTDDNFIVSARGVSQILKIDRSTGAVMWKLGGMANEFTFVNDPFANLCGQHTARVLPNGNLLVFDNGQLCWPVVTARGELTRVVEYRLDTEAMTATLVWSYSQSGAYTTSQGSAQRLLNGNTLIGWGNGPSTLATEVDANGTKVWEIEARRGGVVVASYRAFRGAR